MRITKKDAKIQAKVYHSNMKSISKTCKKIAKLMHKESNEEILRAVEIDLSETYKVLSMISTMLSSGIDFKTMLTVNDILTNALVSVVYMYDALKHNTYTKRVSKEEYQDWSDKENKLKVFVDDFSNALDNYKSNTK